MAVQVWVSGSQGGYRILLTTVRKSGCLLSAPAIDQNRPVPAKLEREGKVGAGLTFHGLRHTVGTLLTEAGVNLDTVRRWLGQKTLAMAIHYSETADTSKQMRSVLKKFDPLGSKTRT